MSSSTVAPPAYQLGSAQDAAPARTLLDVFRATVGLYPDAPALDDGTETLSYAALAALVDELAGALALQGIGRGDRVGVRLPSGTCRLYATILAVLRVGAAYVPVDADDPDERAELVFREAAVKTVVAGAGPVPAGGVRIDRPDPEPGDDAWVIFTSGSTGVPKGVAVSHRSAAAFVDAEADLFLPDAPLSPGDRVLAGLSVAFDASCEEMWLAWRNGACLVPAPRSLVRSGVDLGGWLVDQGITVISTVPTLAALWPQESLDAVRLLIFGGEACPPELVDRLTDDSREVWNTYGPTEATVVATAARLVEGEPVRIGLPLAGWEVAVVDADEQPVGPGEPGQLIIGGVGLAHYLDAEMDAVKFAPMPSLGWQRAYRSGDLVRLEPDGLSFVGRADDQVKVGGRRIELGEVDDALLRLPGVAAAATAVRRSPAGHPLLIGYVVTAGDFDRALASARLRESLPAALVPVLAPVELLPTRTSGKVDRDALPWPLPGTEIDVGAGHGLTGTAAWLAGHWSAVLGAPVTGPDDDFFAHGGGSLAAAQLVSRIRTRYPSVTVGDVYRRPQVAVLAALIDDSVEVGEAAAPEREIRPTPRSARLVQMVVLLLVATLAGLQWLTAVALLGNLVHESESLHWVHPVSWWWVGGGVLLLLSPIGRMGLSALAARALLAGVGPGDYPRGGSVHLRLWTAERLAEGLGAAGLAGAPWVGLYARALGAKVGRRADLHSLPPITGLLTLGSGCAVEPEVDLSGYWLDGDVLHIGRTHIGKHASVGARSILGPGAWIGPGAEVEPGSFVSDSVPAGQRWTGSPAVPVGRAGKGWPEERPSTARTWPVVYVASSMVFALLPVVATVPALLMFSALVGRPSSLDVAAAHAIAAAPLVALAWYVVMAVLLAALIRLLGVGIRSGSHPVRSRVGWQVWATERLLDAARVVLFPLYSSLATPTWLRLLGTQVGRDVEASTVLLQPRMTTVEDGAFLADDTMIGSYELRDGWLRIEPTKVGKRGFLGNSGMAGPGRSVPKNGLVAVLSAAPPKAKKGSSWLGSPPARLRRSPDAADSVRTFAPTRRLRMARALVESARVVPTLLTGVLIVSVVIGFVALVDADGYVLAGLLGGVLLAAAGVAAGLLAILAKWLLVGRFHPVEHPLWSSFVWRNELADCFLEMLAAPWLLRPASGTGVLNLFLRGLGARVGRGVWCESYWLPEADLVELGNGVSVNRGCVLQTHLFHDRIMRMDRVRLGAGATLGPHCVILPAAGLGPGTVIGPSSLVMRGETVPGDTRWIGNPIGPWAEVPNQVRTR
jgi:non-ribosomal peptide synthetase-like protein